MPAKKSPKRPSARSSSKKFPSRKKIGSEELSAVAGGVASAGGLGHQCEKLVNGRMTIMSDM